MGSLVSIQGNNVEKIEHAGLPVVTLRQVDSVHGRPYGSAARNFRKNASKFIDGVDYFRRNSSEAMKEFNTIAPNGLILLTESGYLMIVKSFTDELSWKVQRELVNVYFRGKNQTPMIESDDLKAEVTALKEEIEQMKKLLAVMKPARMKTAPVKPENRNFLYDRFSELYGGEMSVRTWLKMTGCPLHVSIVSSAIYQNVIPGEMGLAVLMKYLKFSNHAIRAKLIEIGKEKGIAELLA